MPAITFTGTNAYANGTSFSLLNNYFPVSGFGSTAIGGLPSIVNLTNRTETNPSYTQLVRGDFVGSDYFSGTTQLHALTFQAFATTTSNNIITISGIDRVLPWDRGDIFGGNILAAALVDAINNILSGDDQFTISGQVASAWGDYQSVPITGNIRLGNDVMRLSGTTAANAGTNIVFWGDAQIANSGFSVIAGNDLIDATSVSAPLTIYGDFQSATGNVTWGNDRIIGGNGADTIYGDGPSAGNAGGNDEIFGGFGADTIFGNGGDDVLEGGNGADILDGGEGFDIASYGNSYPSAVTADLLTPANNTNDALGDTYVSIEGLRGSRTNDILRGDNGNNLLQGLAGADSLNGRGGNDTLDGGTGVDTGVYSGTRANYLITRNSNGTLTVTDRRGGAPDGVDTLSGIERFQFSNTTVTLGNLIQRSDVNGSGGSDLMLRGTDGAIVTWNVVNGVATSATLAGFAGAGWNLLGTGDFNGDGTSDLLFQNGGSFVSWTMSGGSATGGTNVGFAPGWTFAGTGDFNADGSSDVLLFNSGQLVEWNVTNGVATSGNTIGYLGAGWNVVGTGDFNGDGSSDILLQNGAEVIAWNVVNGALVGGAAVGYAPGWSVVGTGDFNSDGTTDVLLRNGSNIINWIVQNNVAVSSNGVGAAGAGWNVIGTGDYNNDGTADIALQNGGSVLAWIMQNGVIASSNAIGNSGTYTVTG